MWKTILYEMTKKLTRDDDVQRELILSASLGIWALIQLKLQQIKYLIDHSQNMKTKYVENFIQELVVNKLNLLKNEKLINNSNRFKTIQTAHGLQIALNVSYPE